MNYFLDTAFELLLSNGAAQMIGAALWGVASVLLSPCGIAVVPLVVGYIADAGTSDDDAISRWEAFKISCAFCAGIIVNLSLVAFVTSSFGFLLGGHERFLTFVTAAVFIIMGLHMIGLLRVKLRIPGARSRQGQDHERHGLHGALALGIVSGLAVGPCSIAYISPLLSIALSRAGASPALAIGLILCYALGYCAVLVFAGTFAQLASNWLQGRGSALRVLNILCGIALIAAGAYLVREQLLLFY